MAKHRSRRRRIRGRYVKGNVDEGLGLGTLSGKTLVSGIFDEVMVESGRISSIVGTYAISDMTPAANDGPIEVGLAHSDYTDAEIEAVIENTGSWDVGNKIQQEIAKRLVRTIGVFESATDALGVDVLNDGKPIKTRLNWHLTTGQSLRLWAYNQGSSALATTAPIVTLAGHVNIFLK